MIGLSIIVLEDRLIAVIVVVGTAVIRAAIMEDAAGKNGPVGETEIKTPVSP